MERLERGVLYSLILPPVNTNLLVTHTFVLFWDSSHSFPPQANAILDQ